MPRSLLPVFAFFIALPVLAEAQTTILSGIVTDAASATPVEFATVMLADAASGEMIEGTTTDLDGAFRIEAEGPLTGKHLEVSFIGFETLQLSEFPTADGEGRVELGAVALATEGQLLDEVVVRAEQSQTTFRLDKRVFNVGKDLASTGSSALEVLDNVPSVNVDIEGNVSLRGSEGVQILINGKPSVLTNDGTNALSTLTADMIERVEVITNPSAKYDAEGTAGILNIVIRKDERRGLNGAVSVNGGYPANHSVGLSLNRRTERFNLFSQLGVGYRKLPTDVVTENRNLLTGTVVRATGEEFRNEQFYNLVLGTDYHPTERDVITLSGNVAYEIEDQPSAFDFVRLDGDGATEALWRRSEETEATNPKLQYELQWAHDFDGGASAKPSGQRSGPPEGARPGRAGDDREHALVASVVGSYFAKDQESLFENTTVEGVVDQAGRQRTATDFGEAETTFKLDYTRPLGDDAALETGAQYVINDVSNDFAVANELGGEFVVDPDLTNVFDWDQRVLGVYTTGAYELGDWGLKAGLRLEHTSLETLLRNTGEVNDQTYTNLFPSAHASYKVTDAVSLQAGYSRRIFRPRLWDLNPFFNIRNNFSYRVGNPDLGPEFTDSYEVQSVYVFEQASFNLGAYHRHTTELVERVTTFDDNVAITQPFNVGTERATGLELNGKYTPVKAFTLRGDLNASAFTREGAFVEQTFDFSAQRWSGMLAGKVRTGFELEVELTGRYRSGYETFQGEVSEQAWLDLGVRQPLFGGRGSLNLAVRDVLASRVRESYVFQDDFETYAFGQRGRFVTLGFSYGFGKGDTMEYLGQRRRF